MYKSQVNPAPRLPSEDNSFCIVSFVCAEAQFLPWEGRSFFLLVGPGEKSITVKRKLDPFTNNLPVVLCHNAKIFYAANLHDKTLSAGCYRAKSPHFSFSRAIMHENKVGF
jgi:hypothetical protein